MTNTPTNITDRRKWLILTAVSLGVFMSTLDASIVNIALPHITAYYKAPLSMIEWVVMIYLLMISSLLLTYGRLGDMYGHKPIYVSGFALFTLASALNSLSPTIELLIAARALQAVGAGMIMAVVQALIAATFAPSERGRAIGINAMAVSLGLATGPAVGGFLVSHFAWQSIFMINIPIGIAGTLWSFKILPHYRGTQQNFDAAGAFMSFLALSSLLLALSHGQDWGWRSPVIITLLVSACGAFMLFLYIETHTAYPMLRLKLFSNRLFAAANIAAMLNYLTQNTVVFLMPFYLENVIAIPVNRAGLYMSIFPLAMMVIAPVSGTLSDRFGSRALTTIGMGLVTAAVLVLSRMTAAVNPLLIAGGLALVGFGSGLFVSPNNNAIMSSVPSGQTGIGSGMIATMRNIGQVLGIAISGAVFSNRLSFYTAALSAQGYTTMSVQTDSFVYALNDTYLAAALFGFLGMLACLTRGKGMQPAPQLQRK